MNTQTFTLPAGTVCKRGGIPFALQQDTVIQCHPEERINPPPSAAQSRCDLARSCAGLSARVAELIGTSETTVSRFKDVGLEQAAALIAACGLKVVSESAQVLEDDYVKALKLMAGVGLAQEAKTSDWGSL